MSSRKPRCHSCEPILLTGGGVGGWEVSSRLVGSGSINVKEGGQNRGPKLTCKSGSKLPNFCILESFCEGREAASASARGGLTRRRRAEEEHLLHHVAGSTLPEPVGRQAAWNPTATHPNLLFRRHMKNSNDSTES